VINKHGGVDAAEPQCMEIYEDLGVLGAKKEPFRKKDFKYLKGTECWDSVKVLHKMYNESWTSIREERAELQVEVMDMIDLMSELAFDPFSSGNNQDRKDFFKFMRTPYQNGAQGSRNPSDIPIELVQNLDSQCVDEESDIKGFEYYSKLSEFYDYRLDNQMESEVVARMFNPDIAEDCPQEVTDKLWNYVNVIHAHSSESLGYMNRSQLISALFEFLENQDF